MEPGHDSHRSGSTLAVTEPTMTSLLRRVARSAVERSAFALCWDEVLLYAER